LAAQTLPLVALLLIGGVWADRLPRNRIMIGTDLVRAGLHALLAALIFAGAVRIWHIVVIEAAFGAAQAFFQPAYTGLIPQTVPESRIQDAKALSETTSNLAFLIGPLLATALVLGVGAGEAFALDAATFVIGALVGLRWRPARPLLVGMLLVMAWPVQDGLFALGAPVAIVAVAAFGTGVGFSLLMIFWETALARHIPPRALGRVSAWDWMGS